VVVDVPESGRGRSIGVSLASGSKMAHFRDNGLSGFTYMSHTCFEVLSATQAVTAAARERLLMAGLPDARILDA
jgi:hypothetical protein